VRQPSPPEIKKTSRRVRFTEPSVSLLIDCPLASEMSEQEKGELWWRKKDFRHFRMASSTLCRSMRSRPKACGSNESYPEVLRKIYEHCCASKVHKSTAEENQGLLVTWAKNGVCRRGLELHILPSLYRERGNRRDLLVSGVLRLQSQANPDNDALAEDDLAEKMMRCSETISLPARRFARSLALADEACRFVPRKNTREHEETTPDEAMDISSAYNTSIW
jgi:hypothetical protein